MMHHFSLISHFNPVRMSTNGANFHANRTGIHTTLSPILLNLQSTLLKKFNKNKKTKQKNNGSIPMQRCPSNQDCPNKVASKQQEYSQPFRKRAKTFTDGGM